MSNNVVDSNHHIIKKVPEQSEKMDSFIPEIDVTFDEEADGELVMQFSDETIVIPTRYVTSQEGEDGHVYLNIKPGIEDSSTSGGSSREFAVEIDLESDSGNEVEIPLQDLVGECNITDNIDVDFDPFYQNNNEIGLMQRVKQQYLSEELENEKNDSRKDDEEEGEEYFYKALAMSANQITNYRERLQLRKEVTSVVMKAVAKFLESNVSENNTKC